MINSPFYKLSRSNENRLTIIFLFLVVGFIAIMRFFDSALRNEIAINGIVSFELAKDLSRTIEIIDSWDSVAISSARLSLAFDFPFLVIYSTFIGLLLHKVNEATWIKTRVHKIGILFIWSIFVAALFDIIENLALIQLLNGNLIQIYSSIAYYFAVAKFIIIGFAIVLIVLSSLVLLFRKIKNYSSF